MIRMMVMSKVMLLMMILELTVLICVDAEEIASLCCPHWCIAEKGRQQWMVVVAGSTLVLLLVLVIAVVAMAVVVVVVTVAVAVVVVVVAANGGSSREVQSADRIPHPVPPFLRQQQLLGA